MDSRNPYAPPSKIDPPSPARAGVHWLVVLRYGVILGVAGVLVGIFSPPGSLGISYLLSFAFEGTVFFCLAFRHPTRPVLHALLAVGVEYVLGIALDLSMSGYMPVSPEPLVLIAIGWASTLASLATGVALGVSLGRTRQGRA